MSFENIHSKESIEFVFLIIDLESVSVRFSTNLLFKILGGKRRQSSALRLSNGVV